MNNKSTLKLSVIFSILLTLMIINLLTSCKCRACEDKEEGTVPLEIVTKSNDFIISITGKDFFEKYITPDFARTKNIPPDYEMAYKLFMPDKPYVNATIKFTVDSLGKVLNNRDVVGIPRCISFPEQCDFNIDEQSAKQIASNMELQEGVRDWEVGFMWDSNLQRYVWRILATLSEFGGEENYRGTGQEMIIDPNTGEVLELNDWKIN
jgi:hypothetical protein